MKPKSPIAIVILIFIFIPIFLLFKINKILNKNIRTDYVKEYKNFLDYSLGKNWKVVSKKKVTTASVGSITYYNWNIEYKDKDNISRNFIMDNYSRDKDDYHFGFYVQKTLNNLIGAQIREKILSKYIPVNFFNTESQKQPILAWSFVEDPLNGGASEEYKNNIYKKISDPKAGIKLYDFNFKNSFINNPKFLHISIQIDKSINYVEVEKLITSIERAVDELKSYTNNTANCLIELKYDNKNYYTLAIVNGKDVTENIDKDPRITFYGSYGWYINDYYKIEN